MGDFLGFILLPIVVVTFIPLVILRYIELLAARSLKLRWSGVIAITCLETGAYFAAMFFFEQVGWGAAAKTAPELYGPFGSFFWQLFLISLAAYAFFCGLFHLISPISLKSLFKKPDTTSAEARTPVPNPGSGNV